MNFIDNIQNKEVKIEIEKLNSIFTNSFVNNHLEFIAVLRFKNYFANQYFIVYNCKDKLEVQCKVLEWFSRACFKTSIGGNQINVAFHKYMRDCVNKYFSTEFTENDFEEIYTYLGNCINRQKTIKFITSGFDFKILNSNIK